MKKLLIGAALAVSMLAAAPAANAAIAITLPAAAPDGTISAEFGQSGIGAGAFSETFEFNFPVAGTASTGVTSIRVSKATDINFTSVLLNGKAFNIVNGVFDSAILENWPVAAGLQTLFVSGTSGGNGSYSVDLSFAPSAVPEPATWAMMIIGFTGAGVAIRRRRRDDSVAFA
ncbi:MAG: FxDxF family PEP-CTERM protein [Phenylobacterium sp.]|uniref:FxDxF family PEP-CTERM protein n=1 Tax=Phenylobacterium sp. TaxID=1871053 RepID=UPI002721E5E7|nr:FxDxF family PEP-CTERM protein [Phenylobacterium sp.]MDO9433234.1 FxDxF family PEP-CTERM protein [Phenylobacterium sp.]